MTPKEEDCFGCSSILPQARHLVYTLLKTIRTTHQTLQKCYHLNPVGFRLTSVWPWTTKTMVKHSTQPICYTTPPILFSDPGAIDALFVCFFILGQHYGHSTRPLWEKTKRKFGLLGKQIDYSFSEGILLKSSSRKIPFACMTTMIVLR